MLDVAYAFVFRSIIEFGQFAIRWKGAASVDELKGLRHCFIIYEKSHYCEQGTRMKYLLFFLFLFLSLLESRFWKTEIKYFPIACVPEKKRKNDDELPFIFLRGGNFAFVGGAGFFTRLPGNRNTAWMILKCIVHWHKTLPFVRSSLHLHGN